MDLARLVAALFSQLASHHDKAWRLRLDELHDCIRRVLHGARPSSDSASREDVLDLLSLRGVLHVFRRLAANNSQRIRFNRGGEFKTDQLFFYQFALNRCEAYEEEYLRQRTYHGIRSPAPLLVNGPLKNFRPFAKAFSCPHGSAMRPGRVCKF
ncbi:neprilysin-2-like [Haemaphysalis longicornis]